ncbi:MAG TPA: hypothetical protein VIF15_17565 [Polyangiaceae bacterium]
MRRTTLLLAALAAFALPLGDARADDKQQCITASDQGQQLRDDGKYRRAREAFSTCSRDVCPALVKHDCLQWLADLDQTSPSVVINAKDDKGGDLVDVKVLVDGAPLVSKLDGKPTLVDPGQHLFRFESPGFPAVEERVVVHAGEKSRLLNVQFGTPANPAPAEQTGQAPPAPATATAATTAETPPAAVPRSRQATLVSAWVFTGIAAVAFGSEAYFGLSGLSDRNGLKSQPCAQTATCNQNDVDSVRTKFTIADISLGVGIVSAALAAYLFFSAPSSSEVPASTARVDLAPLPGGGTASLGGRF